MSASFLPNEWNLVFQSVIKAVCALLEGPVIWPYMICLVLEEVYMLGEKNRLTQMNIPIVKKTG